MSEVKEININKYQNGKIYKIWSPDYEQCYVGSTCEPLSKRMGRHRQTYREFLCDGDKRKKMTSYKLFDEHGVENCKIELIETYPCNSKSELEAREGHYIRNAENCVNRCIAGRTSKEYREDNKEHYKELHRLYREEHKEHYKRLYSDYYEANKHKLSEKKKQYYQTDPKTQQYYDCPCGSRIRQIEQSRHEKSKKHQKYLKTLD